MTYKLIPLRLNELLCGLPLSSHAPPIFYCHAEDHLPRQTNAMSLTGVNCNLALSSLHDLQHTSPQTRAINFNQRCFFRPPFDNEFAKSKYRQLTNPARSRICEKQVRLKPVFRATVRQRKE
jgi:hypothetical protein